MRNPYANQAHMSADVPPETAQLPSVIGAVFVIEIAWWALGGLLFAMVYSGAFMTGSALEAILSLAVSGVTWVAVGVVMARLQGRRWQNLIRPGPVAMADFTAVIRWSGAVLVGLALWQATGHLDAVATARPLLLWLAILPFALLATLIQTGAEEIYFRGYLQSTLAARFKSPLVWAVMPSFFFGLVHIPNGSNLPETVQIVIYTGIFGLFAADLTARSGTLGAAMGFHFIHNAAAFCIYSFEGSPEAPLALWLFPAALLAQTTAEPGLGLDGFWLAQTVVMLIYLTLAWLAARVAIRA